VTAQAEVGIGSRVMGHVPVGLAVPAIAWQFRFFEPELGRLAEFVPRDRGAVDVGVWWGPWTWWLARRVPRVDSFEPNLDLVARLDPIMPPNVTLHPIALSDRAGEADFWVPSGGTGTEGRGSLENVHGSDRGWRQVPAVTGRLDDFDLGDVGFIKIDVEGHEFPVLVGAQGLIDRQRPTVLVEIELRPDRQGPIDDIIDFFADRSYRGEFLQRGRWRPIAELDRAAAESMAARVARHGYATNLLLHSRRFIHNFVFRPT
jgi:FkbM family methyltransferase